MDNETLLQGIPPEDIKAVSISNMFHMKLAVRFYKYDPTTWIINVPRSKKETINLFNAVKRMHKLTDENEVYNLCCCYVQLHIKQKHENPHNKYINAPVTAGIVCNRLHDLRNLINTHTESIATTQALAQTLSTTTPIPYNKNTHTENANKIVQVLVGNFNANIKDEEKAVLINYLAEYNFDSNKVSILIKHILECKDTLRPSMQRIRDMIQEIVKENTLNTTQQDLTIRWVIELIQEFTNPTDINIDTELPEQFKRTKEQMNNRLPELKAQYETLLGHPYEPVRANKILQDLLVKK